MGLRLKGRLIIIRETPIPLSIKKISIRLLLLVFRGLIALKRLLSALFLLIEKPLFLLWKTLFHPFLTLIYRIYLIVRKAFAAIVEAVRQRAVGFFTSKHVVQAVVVLITCLVTISNVYTSRAASSTEDDSQQSIFAAAGNAGEDLLVEDDTADLPAVESESYLGDQALTTNGAYDTQDISDMALDEGSADIGDTGSMLNSVRPLPDTGDAEQPPTRTAIVQHMVQDGETISEIAEKYGLKALTIIIENNLGSQGFIRPGQVLRILPVNGITYKIKKGDTLDKVAIKYSSDTQKIMEINGFYDASQLAEGTQIVIPDGKLPLPPPVRTVPNIRDIFTPSSPAALANLLWPAGVRRITQYFKGRTHTGVDIAGPVGTPIYAADDGVIIYAGWNSGGYGNMTLIDHGNGLFTRYGHAKKLLTKVGQVVQRGDMIALMGSTGRSTGPHLHFEVMTGNVRHRVNPFSYVK